MDAGKKKGVDQGMNEETILQNRIRCALSEHGICIRMNTGYFWTDNGYPIKCGVPGMPDLIWIGPDGKTVWLEVKTRLGIAQDNQKRFMSRLTELGHTAGIVRSVADALKLIGKI
jgi:hypothetical protein